MSKKQNPGKENQQPRQDQDLPGYPHYPSEDDITNPQHGFRKVAADDELANSRRLSARSVEDRDRNESIEPDDENDDLQIVSGTEADVTEEDLLILGDRDADQDLGDDEETGNARVDEVDQEADLDIPGGGMDDEEALGQDDEENNYYSLGGDRHENLEEDPPGYKE